MDSVKQSLKEASVPMSEWSEYKELVMYRLDEIASAIKEVNLKQDIAHASQVKLDKRLDRVELKSGAWGTIGGGLAFLGAVAFEKLKAFL